MQNNNLHETTSTKAFEVNIGSYISQAFNTFGKRPGLFIGALLIFMLINIGMSIIPFIGSILGSFVVQPILLVGFFVLADKVFHNDNATLSDLFEGFKKQTGNIILANFILLLIIMIPVALFMGFLFALIGTSLLTAFSAPEQFISTILASSGVTIALAYVVLLVLIIYISVAYQFGSMFVFFKNFQAWDALEASRTLVSRKFFSFLGLLLVLMLINLLGMIALVIGLIVTIPVSYIAIYIAFNSIVGSREELDDADQIIEHIISE